METFQLQSGCYQAELTASADVDVQVAFDNSAAFQGLSSVYRVDDLLLTLTHFITETITGCAGHAGERGREGGRGGGRDRQTGKECKQLSCSSFITIRFSISSASSSLN